MPERSPSLLSDPRGSLFVEYLLVFPAFALLFVLGLRVALWSAVRSELQEQVASCALAYAVDQCDTLMSDARPMPPLRICLGPRIEVRAYGDGTLGSRSDGREVTVSYDVGVRDTRYQTSYRISCNVRRSLMRWYLDTTTIVNQICGKFSGAEGCKFPYNKLLGITWGPA